MGFAIEACRREVVFRPADMRRFAATLLRQVWNGSLDDPRLARRVDGSDGEAETIRDWIDLSQWEPQVWPLCWALFNRLEQPAREIPTVLQGWQRLQEESAQSRRARPGR